MTSMPGVLTRTAYSFGNRLTGTGRTSGRPILLVGNGRSGTSWMGQTLGWAERVLYYREPCHPYRNGIHDDAEANKIWARYLRPGDSDPFFETKLGKAFEGHFWQGSGHPPRAFARRIASRPRVLVKEVASFLSAEWVARKWDPAMVVIFRHPGAYAVSVRRMNHPEREIARLRLMCSDARLVEDHIGDLAAPLSEIDDPMEASLATWGIRTRAALASLARNPEWIRVHYEEVAADPVPSFAALYDRLGLSWSESVADRIRAKTTSQADGQFSTARVSQDRVDAWRKELDAAQAARLRRVIELFELPIYSTASDWTL